MEIKISQGRVFQLKPGDKVWITVPKNIFDDSRKLAEIHASLRAWAGDQIKIMVGPEDVKVKVIRETNEPVDL